MWRARRHMHEIFGLVVIDRVSASGVFCCKYFTARRRKVP